MTLPEGTDAVIDAALERHSSELGSPLEVLRRLGGFEIAAMAAACIAAAQSGIPVLVDGAQGAVHLRALNSIVLRLRPPHAGLQPSVPRVPRFQIPRLEGSRCQKVAIKG